MLMRTDPFRNLERIFEQENRLPRSFPMDAWKRGEKFVMLFDLPGVDRDSIELTVERNVLTIRAERRPRLKDDDELVVAERPVGTYTRQVFLGDGVDTDAIEASYEGGVLELTAPVAESARPRKIAVSGGNDQEVIEAGAKS